MTTTTMRAAARVGLGLEAQGPVEQFGLFELQCSHDTPEAEESTP